MAEQTIGKLVKIILVILVIAVVCIGAYLIFNNIIHPWFEGLFPEPAPA